nr:GAF domain-containing protein [uncultured Holophaga sp.]
MESMEASSPSSDPLRLLLSFLAHETERPSERIQEGLSLVVALTGIDRTMLATRSSFGLETLAWATHEGLFQPDWSPAPATGLCQAALEGAPLPLEVEDIPASDLWGAHPDSRELGIEAYLGIPVGNPPLGVISLQSASPRRFSDEDRLVAQAMAALFAPLLELEQLREELHRKDEVLALHSAIADDHALEHPQSQLPTRRYLEIWARANLSRARRSREKIGVVLFDTRRTPGGFSGLETMATHLRGEDLLVDLGGHQVLLVVPATNHGLMGGLLRRMQSITGHTLPCGATLCDPSTDLEGGQPSLSPAIARALLALSEAGDTPHWIQAD